MSARDEYQDPMANGQRHPLADVDPVILHTARESLRGAVTWKDITEDMREPIADALVMALLPWLTTAEYLRNRLATAEHDRDEGCGPHAPTPRPVPSAATPWTASRHFQRLRAYARRTRVAEGKVIDLQERLESIAKEARS